MNRVRRIVVLLLRFVALISGVMAMTFVVGFTFATPHLTAMERLYALGEHAVMLLCFASIAVGAFGLALLLESSTP